MARGLTEYLQTTAIAEFEADWKRQRHTAADILTRMDNQEGVILADQVGMGKTYVALAVAVSEILSTPTLGQVVIVVPAAVADKWVREWYKFSESLLKKGSGIRCVDQPVRSGEEFLRRLEEHSSTRKHIIVVTHTALTSSLKDSFIQLALLHYATRYARNGPDLRKRIAKWSQGRKGLIGNTQFSEDRVSELLASAPSKWPAIWKRLTGSDLEETVPATLENALARIPLDGLRETLAELPVRKSDKIVGRLADARMALGKVTQDIWGSALSSIKLDLPLLIVDEAHRLKNPKTNISGLFRQQSEDVDSAGALNGIFRRMLFLTATPFELGHKELIEVLTRMGAINDQGPPIKVPLPERLNELRIVLTQAQVSALSLDEAWGRISPSDLTDFEMWTPEVEPPVTLHAAAREAWTHARLAVSDRKAMHAKLKKWLIRHERDQRRDYRPGTMIDPNWNGTTGGLEIPDIAAFPFLLAARAQSIATDQSDGRPLFAYGIASSYEAFLRLGSDSADKDTDEGSGDEVEGENAETEDDGEKRGRRATGISTSKPVSTSDPVIWYREEINRALDDEKLRATHPKVNATVAKAAQLWLAGEKCLIFCYFIKTGEAITNALTTRIGELIQEKAASALGTSSAKETREFLNEISAGILGSDSASCERIRNRLSEALQGPANGNPNVVNLVVEAAVRNLRTDSYLVRFTPLARNMTADDVWAGINERSPHGIVLLDRWKQFAKRLAREHQKMSPADILNGQDCTLLRLRADLLGTETRDHKASSRASSVNPVSRAHGGTARDKRERVIAQFNTPYAPDLLVASSVMGEGIDLHHECRFVIHHDLDWNPSILEQRTGRLDRIGAFAERVGKRIEVYEPYLAGTHDEKMFRVVKDRGLWFDIVMGRPAGDDERVTDAEETRVPLHENIHVALKMNLCSPVKNKS